MGKLQDEGVLGDGAAFLEAGDEAGPKSDAGTCRCPAFEGVIEVDFSIKSTDDPRAVDESGIEIKPLLANQAFDGYAIGGAQNEAEPVHCIVDAKVALFVGAKHQAGTELLVEVSNGNLKVFLGIVGVAVSNARAPKTPRIPKNGVEVAFVTHAGGEVSTGVYEVAKCVEAGFSRRDLRSNEGVLLVRLEEHLNVACDLSGGRLVLGEEHPGTNGGQANGQFEHAFHSPAIFRSSS